MIDARWAGRDHFHEVAEALNVSTEMVVSAMQLAGNFTVLYSPDPDNFRDVWCATLHRDEDDVLVCTSQTQVPDFFDEVERHIGEKLG